MSEAAPIYLDHNATTPILPEVLEAMLPFLREHFGNPSRRCRGRARCTPRCCPACLSASAPVARCSTRVRRFAIAVFEHFEEVTALDVGHRREQEVVELCGASHNSIHVEYLLMWSRRSRTGQQPDSSLSTTPHNGRSKGF